MHLEITDEEIEFAEQKLLPPNCHFDNERKVFIKDLSTLDLQAVPGSGKTTALLAKLLILESKMPFADDTGILVLSHTNVAVDEIKEKIGKIAPKLFQYPNYVGTIQSFVDTFLAVPCYTNSFHHVPYGIDDDLYYSACNYLLTNTYNAGSCWLNRKKFTAISTLFSLKYNKDFELTGINGLKDSESKAYKDIKDFKIKCIENGILHYSDAFNLASIYLETVPKIRELLCLRFKFVFVDEMQDMSDYQYNLLEQVFFNGDTKTVFQRIGDTNQAIYSENYSCTENFWILRNKVLQLNGSQRLSKNNASLVQRFAVFPQLIEGRMKSANGMEIDIKPYLIVYKKETINLVIEKFISIINELKDKSKIYKVKNERYAAIGWKKGDSDSEEKYNISSYWKEFEPVEIKSKTEYNTLKDYIIYYDKTCETFEAIRKNILNAFLKILRMEEKKSVNNLYYTKRSLIDYIRNTDLSFYKSFNLELLKSCKLVLLDKTEEALNCIRNFISVFISFMNIEINKSYDFIYSDETTSQTKKLIRYNNIFEKNGVSVQVKTVHSVKGQTYTGILYLDTFIYKFESEKLAPYFIGKSISDIPNENQRVKEAAKVVYVGFSRPTHLLCYAVQKENFENYLSTINHDEWNVIEI